MSEHSNEKASRRSKNQITAEVLGMLASRSAQSKSAVMEECRIYHRHMNKLIQRLVGAGFVEQEDSGLKITDAGKTFADSLKGAGA